MAILTAFACHWMINRVVSDRAAAKAAVATLLILQLLCTGVEVARANTRVTTWADQRQDIVRRLSEQGGQHLILVRYPRRT